MMMIWTDIGKLGLLALTFGLAGCAAYPPKAASPKEIARGEADYRGHCASCHGLDGGGGGPVATFLITNPSDLTLLAQKNGGVFPQGDLRRIIDGRLEVLIHGTRAMPIWGNAFRFEEGRAPLAALDNQERDINRRIDDLVSYLATLQKPAQRGD